MTVEYAGNATIQALDYSIDLTKALLWQYNEAPNLQGLINAKNTWYSENQTDFWNDWYNDVFNLATANDFGLAVWSIILGQPTYINNSTEADTAGWGFGQYRYNFTNGNFASYSGQTYQFPSDIARIILQLRYFQLVSSGTVPETNRMLAYVFQNYGKVWIVDNLNMTQQYYFAFSMPSDLLLALTNFDILPRPAGVQSTVYQGAIIDFGFGSSHANFTNGGFGA